MSATVMVGISWGDESKGRLVDYYSKDADYVARYSGAHNAGHTIIVNGEKYITRLMPSGILWPHVKCVLGQGMVIDLITLTEEVERYKNLGLDGRLIISSDAHVVFPYHKEVDSFREESSKNKIGTTKNGIGPTYEDKVGRRGIRIKDLFDLDKLKQKIESSIKYWNLHTAISCTADSILQDLVYPISVLKPYIYDNVPEIINEALNNNANILFEGAQGTLLDVDYGTYPYVTSSSAIAGGVCSGIGVGPTKINKVIGIFKAYTTRVGEGPFPTEINGSSNYDVHVSNHLRTVGKEFGSVTGRPRRVGWLSIPDLKYACMVNGVSKLAISKLDVLSGLDTLQICVTQGTKSRQYAVFKGWQEDISKIRKYEDLPLTCREYLEFIQGQLKIPYEVISVGPDRDDLILV